MDSVLRIAPLIATPISLVALVVLVTLLISRSRAKTLRIALQKAEPSDVPAVIEGAPAAVRDLAAKVPKAEARQAILDLLLNQERLQLNRLRYAFGLTVLLAALAVVGWVVRSAYGVDHPPPKWSISQPLVPTKSPEGWTLGVVYEADGVRGGELGLEVAQGDGWGGPALVRADGLRSGPRELAAVAMKRGTFASGIARARLVVRSGARLVHVSEPVSFTLDP